MPTEALAANVDRPAVRRQRPGQRDRRDQRAALAEHRGERGDERAAHRREPRRDQPQHADEHHRVAHARRTRGRPAHRRTSRCRRSRAGPAVMNTAPAISSRCGPNRSSSTPTGICMRGVHQQLQHRERRQLGGGDVEALGRDQAGDAERGAVEDRQEVDRDAGAPHDEGPAAAEPVPASVTADSRASAIDHCEVVVDRGAEGVLVVAAQRRRGSARARRSPPASGRRGRASSPR